MIRNSTTHPFRHVSPVVLLLLLTMTAAACSTPVGRMEQPEPSPMPPMPDPRIGLRAGWMDAQEAAWNIEIVAKRARPERFFNPTRPGEFDFANSDIAFSGNYVFQGGYNGVQIWDISNPIDPKLRVGLVCPGGQGDVSVFRNLMFMSVEETRGRLDCGAQGIVDTVSADRLRGVRIYDISDIDHPRPITTVQTCRGSHTHTLVSDPHDRANVYVYVSGTGRVRSASELTGCSGGAPADDPSTALFRIDVIRVPLASPKDARIVSSPRIFADASGNMAGLQKADTTDSTHRLSETSRCHDITAYSSIGLAAGACSGNGILLDIRSPANPRRITEVSDPEFAFWHSATFNNDGSKVLFSDEWGGGTAPRCRATDRRTWGADAIYSLANGRLQPAGFYKLPAPQTDMENCVAHNGSLIPVPGRDIMVQAWYQGGLSVFDFTNPARPREIAFFDRGPLSATELLLGGYWSTYWYNGRIYGSEIARGLDVFELKPSAYLSRNEIDAAKLVRVEQFNAQDQQAFVWPASFVVARAYLDQLRRGGGLTSSRSSAIAKELDRAERLSGTEQQAVLSALTTRIEGDVSGSNDPARVRWLASATRDLTARQR